MQIIHRGKHPVFSSKQIILIILKESFISFYENKHVNKLCR